MLFALNNNLAGHRLGWVGHVLRELFKRFVVAPFGRMRWLEWGVVGEAGRTLGRRLSMWDRNVFSVDGLILIESGLRRNSLGEWLFLQFALVIHSFFLCKFFRTVIIIFHVGDGTAEGSTVTILALLGRISQKVWSLGNDGTLLVTVLLLNVSSFVHVLECGADLL